MWLSGLITTQSIRLAAASPQSVEQSQAAGCRVFPLHRRSCAAWLIPSVDPKRALGLERPLEAGRNPERGSGPLSFHCSSLLKSWDLRYIEGTLASRSPDTRFLWPPASQPSALPQRSRNEGTMACTHSAALSRTLYSLGLHGYICGEIIRAEATVFSETLEQAQAWWLPSQPPPPNHFSLRFWRN